MKCQLMILSFVLLTAGSVFGQAQDREQKMKQMMEMMQDSTMEAMVMEQIAMNPQMRQKMIYHMMRSISRDSTMMPDNMGQMMNDPKMKERMKQHMKMMQTMMDGGRMDHSGMMENMEHSDMMKMHLMFLQMMSHRDSTASDGGNGNDRR